MQSALPRTSWGQQLQHSVFHSEPTAVFRHQTNTCTRDQDWMKPQEQGERRRGTEKMHPAAHVALGSTHGHCLLDKSP